MPRLEKSKRLELKGDRLLKKGKVDKALKKYKKALKNAPSSKEIYDKLIQTADMKNGEWNMDDFLESVGWVMKKQEQETPHLRHVHAMLSPEWNDAYKTAIGILSSNDEDKVKNSIESLVEKGEIGTRAIAQILVEMKSMKDEKTDKSE